MGEKKEITTIKLSKETAKALNQLKIHPRQSYDEVIRGLLNQKQMNREKQTKKK